MVVYGPFRLDTDSRQLFRLEAPVGEPLSAKESTVLSVIMSAKGKLARYGDFPGKANDVVWYVNAIKKRVGSAVAGHIRNQPGEGYWFELHTRDLSGRRIHIAGSGINKNLKYAHALTKALVRHTWPLGSGFVVSAGGDPKVGRHGQTFDWTVLETCHELLKASRETSKPPTSANRKRTHQAEASPWLGRGKRIVNIHADDIAGPRAALWRSLVESGEVDHFVMSQNPRVAEAVERTQARFSDILIAMGGRFGVEMLAERYRRQGKHVIPLDIELGSDSDSDFTAAQKLRTQALQDHCEGWFSLREGSTCSLAPLLELTASNRCAANVEEVCSRIIDLLVELAPPHCVVLFPPGQYARESVEWCEVIAARVLREFGFRVVCAEARNTSTKLFTTSALTVIDLTGLDPHCVFQAGAAQGVPVESIWSARADFPVPLSGSIFRWSPNTTDAEKNADAFREFLRSYFMRRPADAR